MKKRQRAGYLEGIVSIVANVVLFGLKLWAGIISNSIALVADAWHTLSDSASSVIVIAGTKLSARKADKEHPFGHGRWEHIAALFIGFLLSIIAWNFIKDSVINFREGESADFGLVAIIVTIVSILVKEGLAQYAFYLSRKFENASVKADGWHHRTDALSSLIVLIGIMLRNYFWWIDSVLGIIISLMIFYAAYEIVAESINKILGEKPSQELVNNIKSIVHSTAGKDLHPHHFQIHNYVNHKELTFHIIMDGDISIIKGHDLITKIENEIRNKLDIESTIHMEPVDHG
ncbi:MAG: cation diffusion facilitator family transporter [Bacteroidota bacterium]|nr:cation diffusion facilitator family transporter [Bacteroidota bacterium]